MPMYDKECLACGAIEIDVYESMNAPSTTCACGGAMQRVVMPGKSNAVVDDSIPGGLYIKHGLCNPDGSPRRFDSHTDIKKAAELACYSNVVEHKGSPGSDKSKQTTRWVSVDLRSEEERQRGWREHELKEFGKLPEGMI